jgi:hypothetical protein
MNRFIFLLHKNKKYAYNKINSCRQHDKDKGIFMPGAGEIQLKDFHDGVCHTAAPAMLIKQECIQTWNADINVQEDV